ncbi:putative capsular polysaccharide synthesis family protein [Paenibacillus sp. NPDC057967]|uniref:putative capsular polysaccharide synthesis family protein n=1 Tax=Paenibacillus sp. NPDC057967 TaxID=3346293 RepID=UPI0036D947CF
MTNNLKIQKKFESLFENKIVLYGAGVTGVETYKILTNYFKNVDVTYFCDTYKTGHMSGLPIISPEELEKMSACESLIVIVTALSTIHKEIADKLQCLDIAADRIYTLSEFDNLIMQNLNDSRIDEWYRTIKRYKGTLPNDEKRNIYLNWWCPEHYCESDILVYQPGKVGSSTICNSLSTIGVNVTHVHMFTDYFIYDLIPELVWEPEPMELETIRKSSRYCSDKIKQANHLKIITLVREPLSRDYSQFLLHLSELVKHGYLSSDDSLLEACAEGIRKRAIQNGKCKYGYQFEWFNKELKEVFGVDVYNHPFDKEKGYSIIKQDNIEVLVVKLEKLNDLEQVVGEFANAPNFKLFNVNIASEKDYKELYKSIRESVKIPREVVSLYYNGNRYMDHFYSEEEKKSFLLKWQNNIAD